MSEAAALLRAIDATRLMQFVLVGAILLWWTPSLARVVNFRQNRARKGDAARAVCVALAITVGIFDVKWMWPHLSHIAGLRLWLAANIGMMLTLMLAIYVHGRSEVDGFRVGRAVLIHLLMIVGCLVTAVLIR